MILVGKKAPNFHATVVMQDGSIDEKFEFTKNVENHYALLFFYPLDFTFVCPSEIIALSKRAQEFKARSVKPFLISVDSHFSHIAYRNTKIEDGGIGNIDIPMISDISKNISKDFDVLTPGGVALRGTFLIDKAGIVRHQLVNDLPLGRNIDETIRTIDALIHFEIHGEVCPAGWKKGNDAMKPNQEGVASYLKKNSDIL